MSTVTNGQIEFERVLRPADFESKRVKVNLSYAVDDGEDPAAAAARVGDMAHAEVFRMLAKAEKAKPAAVEAPKPPKVETPTEVAQPNPTSPSETSDATDAAQTEPSSAVTEQTAPLVTDAELQAACQRARARGCTPDQLKELIATMVPQVGMRIVNIADPAGRAAALAKVDALQAGAATTAEY